MEQIKKLQELKDAGAIQMTNLLKRKRKYWILYKI
jgi:hypothetical protein